MRTTISVSDATWREVQVYASSRGLRLGQAVEELLRRGLSPRPMQTRPKAGGWIPFDVPADAPRITSEQVKKLIEEMDDEEAARCQRIGRAHMAKP